MEILEAKKLAFFALFCLPGIIFLYMRSQFGHGRVPKFVEGISSYVSISLLYHSLAFIFGVTGSVSFEKQDICSRLGLFAYFFLAPALIGILVGMSLKKDILYNSLKKIGLDVVHPIPTAWDYCFNRYPESWVTITLKNGLVWRGHYSINSFASTDPAERDILIDRVCEYKKGKSWIELGTSVLISKDEIQTIEFHKPNLNKENEKNDGK